MEFRTNWETETKVKKKCDSAKGWKKKDTKSSELGRSEKRSLKKWHRYGLEG